MEGDIKPPEGPGKITVQDGYKKSTFSTISDVDRLMNVSDKLPVSPVVGEQPHSTSSDKPILENPLEERGWVILQTTPRWDKGLVAEKLMDIGMSANQAKIFIIKHRPDLA